MLKPKNQSPATAGTRAGDNARQCAEKNGKTMFIKPLPVRQSDLDHLPSVLHRMIAQEKVRTGEYLLINDRDEEK